jgi:hypothetical protein
MSYGLLKVQSLGKSLKFKLYTLFLNFEQSITQHS